MNPQTPEALTDKDRFIDYKAVLDKFPWLVQKDQNCILSPDSDGLLCGLLMSHYFGWKIRGFYDGKVLLIEVGFDPKDCIFLDMEIFRKDVRSIGQHMIMYNRDNLPLHRSNLNNCISANNLRDYDMKHNFSQKYPFGTIHLLLAIVGSHQKIEIPTSGICPLLYTDGTFKNLFNYPENCLSWLQFLKVEQDKSSLHDVFFNDHYSISSLMFALADFFKELHLLANGKRGGDKIKFSSNKSEMINFDKKTKSIKTDTREQAEQFLRMLSGKVGWSYNPSHWSWSKLRVVSFKKGSIKPSQGRYNELMEKSPLSLAIISGLSIEFTLDPKKKF